MVFTETIRQWKQALTNTGENVQKWTRVFSTRCWVILVAWTRRKKEKEIACPLLDVFAFEQVSSHHLYRLTKEFWSNRKKSCWQLSSKIINNKNVQSSQNSSNRNKLQVWIFSWKFDVFFLKCFFLKYPEIPVKRVIWVELGILVYQSVFI